LKLEEAAFFLEHADRNQDDVRIFGFYISAFFSAAASIRNNVMLMEYQRIQGFNDWYKKANYNVEVNFRMNFG
jgi:hypothetical protein